MPSPPTTTRLSTPSATRGPGQLGGLDRVARRRAADREARPPAAGAARSRPCGSRAPCRRSGSSGARSLWPRGEDTRQGMGRGDAGADALRWGQTRRARDQETTWTCRCPPRTAASSRCWWPAPTTGCRWSSTTAPRRAPSPTRWSRRGGRARAARGVVLPARLRRVDPAPGRPHDGHGRRRRRRHRGGARPPRARPLRHPRAGPAADRARWPARRCCPDAAWPPRCGVGPVPPAEYDGDFLAGMGAENVEEFGAASRGGRRAGGVAGGRRHRDVHRDRRGGGRPARRARSRRSTAAALTGELAEHARAAGSGAAAVQGVRGLARRRPRASGRGASRSPHHRSRSRCGRAPGPDGALRARPLAGRARARRARRTSWTGEGHLSPVAADRRGSSTTCSTSPALTPARVTRTGHDELQRPPSPASSTRISDEDPVHAGGQRRPAVGSVARDGVDHRAEDRDPDRRARPSGRTCWSPWRRPGRPRPRWTGRRPGPGPRPSPSRSRSARSRPRRATASPPGPAAPARSDAGTRPARRRAARSPGSRSVR